MTGSQVAIDTAILVRARLELDRQRLAAVEALHVSSPAAEVVRELAGDRLGGIVSRQRAELLKVEELGLGLQGAVDAQRGTDRIASEALALAMGAVARANGLDQGGCDDADRFVAWLAGKVDRKFARPTVPSDEDALHRAVDVIHRRVPDHPIWDLPVMAHEFGHLLAHGLTSWAATGDVIGSPVKDELTGLDELARKREEELFCDLFASWALGPSYLCTLVFHRLDPLQSSDDSRSTHPADAVRVAACLELLEIMRGSVSAHAFDTQLYWARAAWAAMQGEGSSPEAATLTESQLGSVRARVSNWNSVLRQDLGPFVYCWSPAVEALSRHLRLAAPIDGGTTYTAADVLNAAWVVRLARWFDGKAVEPGDEMRARDLLALALESEGTS